MPLTEKGRTIMEQMMETYKKKLGKKAGAKKAQEVFYASANKGAITGVHK